MVARHEGGNGVAYFSELPSWRAVPFVKIRIYGR